MKSILIKDTTKEEREEIIKVGTKVSAFSFISSDVLIVLQ